VEAAQAAAVPVAAGERPHDPLSPRQHRRIARAVDLAENETGLQFAVYIGPAGEDSRAHAEAMFAELGFTSRPAVLLLIAPEQRRLEIVTSAAAKRRISDRNAALVATSMTASFAVGDIVGGICVGLAMLAEYAGPPPSGDQADEIELPDVLSGYPDAEPLMAPGQDL
jgi:uncharacterized membrane protein